MTALETRPIEQAPHPADDTRYLGPLPPQDLRAEESVLGAMLLSRDAVGEAVQILAPDDFYKPAHGHIFDAMMGLYGAGEPVDAVTVATELDTAGLLELVGRDTLLKLQAGCPAVSNAAHYARTVEDKALLRAVIAAGTEITAIGYSNPADIATAVDEAESHMLGVADKRAADTSEHIKDLLSKNLDHIERMYEQGGKIVGTETGFIDLDQKLSGLQNQKLYILGARPSMGKSALALGIAMNVVMKAGLPVVFFSLEMSNEELSMRALCSEALVDSTRMTNGLIEEPEWNRISHAVGRMAETNLVVDDNPRTTIMEIRAKARRLKARHGELGCVVVDYIQLMNSRGGSESRQVEVSEISRGLKILARELDCPVLALAQLNRGLEQRVDKRPMLSDLRESGSLEQDADVVMFLYRDEVYNEQSPDRGVAELLVAKNRGGPTGSCKLAFRGQYTRFDNMARSNPSGPVPTAGDDGAPQYDNWTEKADR